LHSVGQEDQEQISKSEKTNKLTKQAILRNSFICLVVGVVTWQIIKYNKNGETIRNIESLHRFFDAVNSRYDYRSI
jgi:hypothetical protein